MQHSCLISSRVCHKGRDIKSGLKAVLFSMVLLAMGGFAQANCPPDPAVSVSPIAGDGWAVVRWQLGTAGADQIDKYVIYRTTVSGEWTVAATLYHDTVWNSYVDTRTYWDEGLTNGVPYSYVVRAVSGTCGLMTDSATIWVTPVAGYSGIYGPVGAPSGDNWIRLNWDLSATWWTVEPGITVYRIFRATAPELLGRYKVSSSLHAEIPADIGYTDLAGLTNKVSYYYMVFPAYPERTPFFIKSVPFRPLSTAGQPVAQIDGSAPRRIRVTWLPAPAPDLVQSDSLAGYIVFRSDDGGGAMTQVFSVSPTTLSVVDQVPAYGKRYVYLIRAIDDAGRMGEAYPLVIIDVELPSNKLFLNHNRFRPRLAESLSAIFQITESGRVRISVMTLTGEKIKTLYDREHSGKYSADAPFNSLYAGLPPIIWDGSNESGRLVGSGAYLVVLEIGKHRFIGSVAVIR